MTTIIKIDSASIKKNPTAGNTRTHVIGMATTKFKAICTSEQLEKLSLEKDIVIITVGFTLNELITIDGFIEHPDFDITKLPGKWEVNSNKSIETVYHEPEAKYLYKYEDMGVPCSNCGVEILHSEIDQECDDYSCYDVCPKCEKTDTFDYGYESIFIVAKELNL